VELERKKESPITPFARAPAAHWPGRGRAPVAAKIAMPPKA